MVISSVIFNSKNTTQSRKRPKQNRECKSRFRNPISGTKTSKNKTLIRQRQNDTVVAHLKTRRRKRKLISGPSDGRGN